ncbi:DUF4145 domain-containing protein [Fervidobacterium thailandense]|uniref:DUF4145 domain-containing protein n=1 Tax=Fervidobacterium thailandense TaxID=1008305 RepID=A0A1E3G0N1_9BACT|nr:DUF4145 domain-containing protein [Fervidobacterium thailandense]ODN29814.1 hypothetical protein A4H02_08655 [Fervidobacterium thailandense]
MLMRVQPRICIADFRRLGETVCKRVLERLRLMKEGYTFKEMVDVLGRENILSKKAIGYLNVVRTIGNFAVHPSDDVFTDEDVRVVSYAFSQVLKEILEKGLL